MDVMIRQPKNYHEQEWYEPKIFIKTYGKSKICLIN